MISLEELGMTKEELCERVIEALADKALHRLEWSEGDGETLVASGLKRELDDVVKARVDMAVNTIAEKHITPNITQRLEDICIQSTNEWGEKKSPPITFIEYITKRADAWIMDEVDYKGRSREECRARGDSFSGTGGRRISRMVDQYLNEKIKGAVEASVKDINSKLAIALSETVRVKLSEACASLNVVIGKK